MNNYFSFGEVKRFLPQACARHQGEEEGSSREWFPWQAYVCQNIPRHVLEATYGINIIKPREDEDPHRPPTSEELLTAYGCELWFILKHDQKIKLMREVVLWKDTNSEFFLSICHVIFQSWYFCFLCWPCLWSGLQVSGWMVASGPTCSGGEQSATWVVFYFIVLSAF